MEGVTFPVVDRCLVKMYGLQRTDCISTALLTAVLKIPNELRSSYLNRKLFYIVCAFKININRKCVNFDSKNMYFKLN